MTKIDYGKLVDEAMHEIVYKVLKIIESEGLPQDHHFFVSFVTKHPGVKVSESLRNKYPHEMTIVLQYQFHDLVVDRKGFQVTLSFTGSQETIYVPLTAITTFADPSVQFGLQFREAEMEESDLRSEIDDDDLDMITEEIRRQLQEDLDIDEKEGKGLHSHRTRSSLSERKERSGKKESDGDNVVSLDAFRKKKDYNNGAH